ncbi:MAG: TlpA family protein disulfide reductase [Alphaproteobacteria bacterium]|nr:TlpA family protein disulfide reductase [Alphaproteobacteria bacterium]
MGASLISAPPIEAERWFNTDRPLALDMFLGKVVVLHAFQMLCPGCVSHAIPQARRLHEIAKGLDDLVVLGIHTVFEHHAAMTPVSLEAFLHEYRLAFPIAVDRPSPSGPIPVTMAAYGFKGTPTTVVIDREGRIVRQTFGAEDDLVLGLVLGSLLSSKPSAP